jgi:hypothetical protein
MPAWPRLSNVSTGENALKKGATVLLVKRGLAAMGVYLYEAFPAAEARRLVERFEWHYTPKHGSWLDMAESELGVLSPRASF